MRFVVVPNSARPPIEARNTAFLWEDNWNDYWKYQTLYVVTYFDEAGTKHHLGTVKIGQFNWEDRQFRPRLPEQFGALDDRFFSLGQDVTYYSQLNDIGRDFAAQWLTALKDIVADPDLYVRSRNEDVSSTSLFRSVSIRTVEGQFRRVLAGDAVLTEYKFTYQGPSTAEPGIAPVQITFDVTPDSKPPSNVHVIIGRNGVGKSYLLSNMTRALVNPEHNHDADGLFTTIDDFRGNPVEENPFSRLLSVSFSAFDDFVPPSVAIAEGQVTDGHYSYIGLRRYTRDERGRAIYQTLQPSELAKAFAQSAFLCAVGARLMRWSRALATLEADPIFQEAQVFSLVDTPRDDFIAQARALFSKLSSGHKIVLLTVTRLVELVEERTLVLMDEPEAHLHPPLLSAFVRALSDLLINRNGVAVVATHSPVILQEVPASCVWKLYRHGVVSSAERPEIETFGENVGVLTREVFSLEVTRSGFHHMLAEAIGDAQTIEEVLLKFDNEVGSEGRALISAEIARRRARAQQ